MTSSVDPRRAAGFTLIELLVVLVIMALIVGVVTERTPTRRLGLEGRALAMQVSDLLRLARSRAIGENRLVLVTVDGDGQRLEAAGVGARAARPPFVLRLDAGKENAILFAPDGTSSGGRIDVQAGGRHWPLAVAPRTGRVSLDRPG